MSELRRKVQQAKTALRIQVDHEKLGIAVFGFDTDDPERNDSDSRCRRLLYLA